MRRKNSLIALLLAWIVLLLSGGSDWTRFRGPGATGVSPDTGTPTTWSDSENVVWKTSLPGYGASSPVTLDGRIFVTCYRGYGLSRDDPGDPENLELTVLCLDRRTGGIIWDFHSKAHLPEPAYEDGFVGLHGYASSTPATDGENLYVFQGSSGVLALTIDGRELWRTSVGDGIHGWGSATSPVLHDDLVIVNASVESESVVALNKATGDEVWRKGGVEKSWSTPLIVDLPGGRSELVVSLRGTLVGLDPSTGQTLWHCESVQDYVCPSVIADDGIVVASGGRSAALTLAVRAGGRGDVTDTHVVWRVRKTPKVATPLYHEGLVYWIDQRGVAVCVDAESGEVLYQQRLDIGGGGDKVYASLVYADGKLYTVSRQDGAIVLAAGPRFELLARNHLGDNSVFNATPTVSDGQLLIRSDRFLYCIGD